MLSRIPNFDRSLGFIIADLSRLLRQEFDRRVRGLGLTRAQWLLVYHVARREGCTQSDLAESLQREKITISRHVNKLERQHWLRRDDDPKDRRAYRLYLRPKARRLIVQLSGVTEIFREDYFQGLSPERQESLLDDLLVVKRNLVALDQRETKTLK